MEMTERIIGITAAVIVASAGIATCIVLAARRKKAKKATQALLGTIYKYAPTQTKKAKK